MLSISCSTICGETTYRYMKFQILRLTNTQGWIQEFFVVGANLKKMEKMTSAAVGRAKN